MFSLLSMSTTQGVDDATVQMPSLAGLSSLTRLTLDGNLLTLVPQGISALPKLRHVNLAHNKIVSEGTGGTRYPPCDGKVRLLDLSKMKSVEVSGGTRCCTTVPVICSTILCGHHGLWL